MDKILRRYFPAFTGKQLKSAATAAYAAYDEHMAALKAKGAEFLKAAREQGIPIIVLSGRPYHVDPEINHGINTLICKLGAAVVTEDSVAGLAGKPETAVRNQWTYHARLYAAAKFVAESPADMNIHLVQLVSFGCGVDAVTTDETRTITESGGRLYTQIKIDEISNMGAVKIRLRSLFSAMQDKQKK